MRRRIGEPLYIDPPGGGRLTLTIADIFDEDPVNPIVAFDLEAGPEWKLSRDGRGMWWRHNQRDTFTIRKSSIEGRFLSMFAKRPDGIVVEITVTEINGGNVSVGVSAPREFAISRHDLRATVDNRIKHQQENCE